jgi:long-chain acyl-CoA synthetase
MGIYSDKPWMKSYFIGPFKLPKTMEPYPEISVYQLLEETAEEFPENIACEYLDQQINYNELKNKVDRFAAALANLGVKKGDTVVTILPTCIEFIIADYSIMRLGAIHVPLSILHKADDLLYELKESKAETVICSYRRLDRITEIKDRVKIQNLIYTPVAIFPDYTLPEIEKLPDAYMLSDLIEKNEPNPPAVTINAKEDLALLPFTGGTTGVPKGTMLSHFAENLLL